MSGGETNRVQAQAPTNGAVDAHEHATGISMSDGFDVWSVEGHSFEVRYRRDLLRQLCARAVEGFAKIPRGGIEVGGVLFGHRLSSESITIEASREIRCGYENGPGFELSSGDEARLSVLLADAAKDPALQGLEVVGWWHSHTRSEIALSERDLDLYDRFFPWPWQIAAVIRPAQFQPTRIGFFFREADGHVQSQQSYREFTLPKRERARGVAAPDREVETPTFAGETSPTIVEDEPSALVPVVVEPEDLDALPAARRPVRRQRAWPLFLSALLVIGLTAGIWWWFQASTAPDLQLRMTASGETVQIEWDRTSRIVRDGTGADIEIRDGDAPPRFVHLDHEQIAGGRLSYVRNSPSVKVRVRVYGWGDDQREFYGSFVGPPVSVPAVTAPASVEVSPQATPLEQPAAPAAREAQRRQDAVIPAATPTGVKPRPMQLPGATHRPDPVTVERVQAPPPTVALNPQLQPPAVFRPPTAAPPAVAPPAGKVRRAPASGRAIWTGDLRAGATLTLDGARPSFGTINGRLPSGPARIIAHAADLGNEGIVIYSADPKIRAREDTFESPSARNAWNLTTYRWDPKRAGELRVLEAPGPANGWRRLAVRSGGKKLSVIVLDWEELPPGTVE